MFLFNMMKSLVSCGKKKKKENPDQYTVTTTFCCRYGVPLVISVYVDVSLPEKSLGLAAQSSSLVPFRPEGFSQTQVIYLKETDSALQPLYRRMEKMESLPTCMQEVLGRNSCRSCIVADCVLAAAITIFCSDSPFLEKHPDLVVLFHISSSH